MQSPKGRSAAFIALLVCLSLSYVGCSSSTVLATLQTIVDAASAAAGIITALNGVGTISNLEAGSALGYLSTTSSAASYSIKEWESKDATDVKITKISVLFSNVAAAKLQPPVNAEVQSSVAVVSSAIEAFLTQLHTGSLQANAVGVTKKAFPLSASDRYRLHSLKSKADKTTETAELWIANHPAGAK